MDEPADICIARLFDNHQEYHKEIRAFLTDPEFHFSDLPAVIQNEISKDLPLFETLPDWTDYELMRRSETFFSTHTQDIFLLLGVYSLPYCYAAANGAQVLSFSGRMKNDVIQRLRETAQFIFNVLESNAFTGIGLGFESCLKVRLLHAMIRYHILAKGNWDDRKFGQPINQEDMSGTNLAFSSIIIDGLKKFGHRIDERDEEAYLHRWRVIGYLLGLEDKLLPRNRKEFFFLKTNIEKRQVKPSAVGQELAQTLINEIEESPEQPFPKGFSASITRYMLGDKIADMLLIPDSNWTISLVNINSRLNRLKANFKFFEFVNQVRYPLVKDRLMNQN